MPICEAIELSDWALLPAGADCARNRSGLLADAEPPDTGDPLLESEFTNEDRSLV